VSFASWPRTISALKTQYAPTKLLDARARLGDDLEEDGSTERPLPRVVSHRLRHAAGTNEGLQELYHRQRGGSSRNERYVTEQALLTTTDKTTQTTTTAGRLTVWTYGRDVANALPVSIREHGTYSTFAINLSAHLRLSVPRLEHRNLTEIPLKEGVFVVMQCMQCRYIARVVEVFKKVSGRHSSMSVITAKEFGSVSNISVDVFVEVLLLSLPLSSLLTV
jgi:hypothetical protein